MVVEQTSPSGPQSRRDAVDRLAPYLVGVTFSWSSSKLSRQGEDEGGKERRGGGTQLFVCFLALTTHPFRGHEQLTEEKSTAISTKRGWLLLSLVLCCCQDATLLLLFVSKMLRCCCSRCDEGIESTHLSIYLYTIANTAITICDFFPCQSTAILLCTPMGAMRDDSPRK